MSILIKGMDMPKSCVDCKVAVTVNDGVLCTPMFRIVKEKILSERQQNCPLVEVPAPHGDLIEKNVIEKAINDACDECKEACIEFDGFFADCDQCIFQGVKKALIDTPTVIPAEEGE